MFREFTLASLANSRRNRLSLLISSENTATTLPSRIATFCAMLIANAVLPIEGRAAIMISSESCKPLVIRSNSMKCVFSPVISLPCSNNWSIDPKLPATISPIPASPRWIAESATSASSASTSPSTVIASSLWSLARTCPSWKMPINCRSRLLSFTIRT